MMLYCSCKLVMDDNVFCSFTTLEATSVPIVLNSCLVVQMFILFILFFFYVLESETFYFFLGGRGDVFHWVEWEIVSQSIIKGYFLLMLGVC